MLPPPTSPMKWQGGFWKYLGSRGFLSYVPSGFRRVDVVGGVVHGQAFFPRCMLLASQCVLHFHSTNMLCDQHQACEGQHGGLLGRPGNWNVLKCVRANHCKHKYALTKWYIYWNDGFSTEWLADFSLSMTLSMTNSHFLKPLNHTLKNIYKMAFCLLQNGLSWCP